MNDQDKKVRPVDTSIPEIASPNGVDEGMTRREFVASMTAAAAVAATGGIVIPDEAEAAPVTRPIFRIHPSIGVARVGNLSPDVGFIIGPEIPGQRATDGLTGQPVQNYKAYGQIKPQAARFRVYQYEYDQNGKLIPTREVVPQSPTLGEPFIDKITWTVHLANRKASFYEADGPLGEMLPAGALRNPAIANRDSLENDFGPRSISGSMAPPQPFTPWNGGGYQTRVVQGPYGSPLIDYLGELRTDGAGSLLLFGGKGLAASSVIPPQPLTHWANNNYWFDDMSDGPVTAVVTIDDGYGRLTDVPMDDAGHAWALVASPDFSPGLQAGVSLYDLLYDMAVRKMTIPANNGLYSSSGPLARLSQLNSAWQQRQSNPGASSFEFGSIKPDYEREIWPIVLNAANLVYTTALVNFKHNAMLTDPLSDPSASAAKVRESFFNYIRPPENAATNATGPGTMPKMYGDNWYIGNSNFVFTFGQNGPGNAGGGAVQGTGPRAVPKYQRYSTLTPTQYGLLRSWSAGNFTPPSVNPPYETAVTPHGLDRANLENCIGGPFYPGIECSWQVRNRALFIEPFRLNLSAISQFLLPNGVKEGTTIRAGHFSRQMALPWQADFNDCSKLMNLAWWPTARPDDVLLHASDKLSQRVPWARPDTTWPNGSSSTGYDDMVNSWYKFGIVLDDGTGSHIEKERNSHVP